MQEAITLSVEDRAGECRAQSALFMLLGRVLEGEVDRTLLELLRTTLREPLVDLGVDLPEDILSEDADSVLPRLAEEFTGLLVQPGAISPYASVFETGALFQTPCDRVTRWYAEAGFTFRHVYSGEFPDHIGTMLVFVGTQFAAEAEALEAGDREGAETARVRRERFLLEELGGWAPAWCRVAGSVANHPFYAAMLALAERTVWDEVAAIAPPRRLRELSELNTRRPARMDTSPDFRKASGL